MHRNYMRYKKHHGTSFSLYNMFLLSTLSTSSTENTGIEARDLDGLLWEMSAIVSRGEAFNAFMRAKAKVFEHTEETL